MLRRLCGLLLKLLVVAAVTLLPVAGARAAGGSALHIDPSSPVAKAYALPIGMARGTAGRGRETQLFGAGITPAPTTEASRRRSAAISVRAAAYLRPNPRVGWLWMALVAGAVLIAGGLGGFALRRRR